MDSWFDRSLVRFCLSGTLITLYLIADLWMRRRQPARPRLAPPRWMRPLIGVSLTGYYLLIGPTGGALLGGIGNLAGVLLVAVAIVMRASAGVRYPDLGGRSLFYIALPIAVGVPWGLAVLSLPACAASAWCCLRAEREADRYRAAARLPRYRMLPGIW